jgi:two-component system response regulator HydG
MHEGNILVVDDSEEILVAMRLFLSEHFSRVDVCRDPRTLPNLIVKRGYDVVLLDMNFRTGFNTGKEGIHWIGEILKRDPAAAVIPVTAYGNIDLAVEALKAGARDFIQKPWEDEKLLSTVLSAFRLRRSEMEVSRLRNKQKHLNRDMIRARRYFRCESPAIEKLHESISKVAATDANVLVLGENGSGKEVVAREVHMQSERADEVFVVVDMGSLPESLFESELFGYRKGAFTDAREDRSGRLEIAAGGSIFLDEISNVPVHLQAKLLAALQNREIYPLGANRPVPLDARLVTATNKDPVELIAAGRFREDLLYRINTVQLTVPPLRERREDILPLAGHFIAYYSEKYGKEGVRLSPTAARRLQKYLFPGNVRELEHMMEKAVIMCDQGVIGTGDLFVPSRHTSSGAGGKLNLEENERRLISEALHLCNYRQTAACRELGISRKTLYNKMQKYGL